MVDGYIPVVASLSSVGGDGGKQIMTIIERRDMVGNVGQIISDFKKTCSLGLVYTSVSTVSFLDLGS